MKIKVVWLVMKHLPVLRPKDGGMSWFGAGFFGLTSKGAGRPLLPGRGRAFCPAELISCKKRVAVMGNRN